MSFVSVPLETGLSRRQRKQGLTFSYWLGMPKCHVLVTSVVPSLKEGKQWRKMETSQSRHAPVLTTRVAQVDLLGGNSPVRVLLGTVVDDGRVGARCRDGLETWSYVVFLLPASHHSVRVCLAGKHPTHLRKCSSLAAAVISVTSPFGT